MRLATLVDGFSGLAGPPFGEVKLKRSDKSFAPFAEAEVPRSVSERARGPVLSGLVLVVLPLVVVIGCPTLSSDTDVDEPRLLPTVSRTLDTTHRLN